MKTITAIVATLAAASAATANPPRTVGMQPPDLRVEALTVVGNDHHAGNLSTVAVGEEVQISCHWRLGMQIPPGDAPAGVPDFKWSVSNVIAINQAPLEKARVLASLNKATGVQGPLRWHAPAPGQYRIRCALDEANVLNESPTTRANNIAEVTLTATGLVRGL